MSKTAPDLNRLPIPGAGFVWDTATTRSVLRPDTALAVAAFTARNGGSSRGHLSTLNVSFSVGDAQDTVRANRYLAGRTIGRDERWRVVHQMHGADVRRASDERPQADGIWTDDPSDTIAVMAADCVPVLLAGEGRVGAAHAGWRGTIAGVVQNVARETDATAAFAGPGIGPCCFEVGPEVVAAFRERFGDAPVADASHVDLWVAIELAAREAGVREVHASRVCTSCHPELFFSHRRDAGRTGRQALIARLP